MLEPSHPFTLEECNQLARAKILVFGMGPIGAWFAYQLLLERPELADQLVIFEKREQYTRDHALWIDPTWFKKQMHPDSHIPGLTDKSEPMQFRANELEGLLSDAAIKAGAQVIRSQAFSQWTDKHLKISHAPFWRRWAYEKAIETGRKTWIDSILSLSPNADRIVGTDGSHSTIGTHFFPKDNVTRETVRRVVQISVEVDLSMNDKQLALSYPTAGVWDFKALEHVDAQAEGRSKITARFFVDEPTFEQIRQSGGLYASSAKPLSGAALLEGHPLISPLLTSTLKRWVDNKNKELEKQCGSKARLDLNTLELSTILLEQTQAKSCHTRINRRTDVLLEGDAAKFFPFYTSANSSLKTACGLAKACAIDDPSARASALKSTLKQTAWHRFWLKAYVGLKNFILGFLAHLFSLGLNAPIKLTDWTFRQAAQMQTWEQRRREHFGIKATVTHRVNRLLEQHPQLNWQQLSARAKSPPSIREEVSSAVPCSDAIRIKCSKKV